MTIIIYLLLFLYKYYLKGLILENQKTFNVKLFPANVIYKFNYLTNAYFLL
jgi:hypothetical protein